MDQNRPEMNQYLTENKDRPKSPQRDRKKIENTP